MIFHFYTKFFTYSFIVQMQRRVPTWLLVLSEVFHHSVWSLDSTCERLLFTIHWGEEPSHPARNMSEIALVDIWGSSPVPSPTIPHPDRVMPPPGRVEPPTPGIHEWQDAHSCYLLLTTAQDDRIHCYDVIKQESLDRSQRRADAQWRN